MFPLRALDRDEARRAIAAEKLRRGDLDNSERAESLRDRIGLFLRWGQHSKAEEAHTQLCSLDDATLRLPAPRLPVAGHTDAPDTDEKAVAEAHRRVRTRQNGNVWAALQDVTEERRTGGAMQETEPEPAADETELPPLSGDDVKPYRKGLPPNPFVDTPSKSPKEAEHGKEDPGAEA